VTRPPPGRRDRSPTVLLSQDELAEHVGALGRRIATDHPDGVVLVGVLKGALVFLADLARAIPDIDVEIDFLAISRYAPDSGRVRILMDLEADIEGRDVVLVEDMVDTGLTLAYLLRHLGERGPRSVDVCTLLDRPEISDVFVLGYGLHHADLYRNLPFVVTADRAVVAERPEAYVAALYGRETPDLRG